MVLAIIFLTSSKSVAMVEKESPKRNPKIIVEPQHPEIEEKICEPLNANLFFFFFWSTFNDNLKMNFDDLDLDDMDVIDVISLAKTQDLLENEDCYHSEKNLELGFNFEMTEGYQAEL
jgi:hypothetical protein